MKHQLRLNIRYSYIPLVFIFLGHLNAYAPTNFNKPFDRTWIMPYWIDKKTDRESPVKIGMQFEVGSTHSSFNEDSETKPLLEMYQSTQSSIPMLMGFAPGSAISNVLNSIAGSTDDGVRGNFKVSGEYQGFDYTIFLQNNFSFSSIPGKFNATLFVPIRQMRISDVHFKDLTQNITADDLDVKQFVTSDIVGLTEQLGDLDITSWNMRGVGDLALILQWFNDFPQLKRNLVNVRVNGRIGLTIPTGKEKNEDRAFSLPLGNDGAWGIPISAGLDLKFKHTFKGGLEVQYFKLFSKTRTRRLKTNSHQTDFLILGKGPARRDYGSTWQFSLYAGSERFFHGLSAYINYQYYLHNDDRLFAHSNAFNNSIINSAQNLQEYSYHNLLFQAWYDFAADLRSSFFEPQLMFFYKVPFAGRRSIIASTFGAEFSLNF